MDDKTTTKRRTLAAIRKQLELINPDIAHFLKQCRARIEDDMAETGGLTRAAISNGVNAHREDDIRITATSEPVCIEPAPKAIYTLTLFLSRGFFEFGRSCKGEAYQSFAIIELDKFGNRVENARDFLKSAEMYNQEPVDLAWLLGRLFAKVVDRLQNAAMGVEVELKAEA